MTGGSIELTADEAASRVFMPEEREVDFLGYKIPMRPLPLYLSRQLKRLFKEIYTLSKSQEEVDLIEVVDTYLDMIRKLLKFYDVIISEDELASTSDLDSLQKFLLDQMKVEMSESTMVEMVEEKYGIKESKPSSESIPEFAAWYSIAETFGQTVEEILRTNTEGQLRLMALASRIIHQSKTTQEETPKKKYRSWKTMTKDEIEGMYKSSGVFE